MDETSRLFARIPKSLEKQIEKLVIEKPLQYPTKSQVIRIALDMLMKKENKLIRC